MCNLKNLWAKLVLCLIPFTCALTIVADPAISIKMNVESLEDIYCDGVSYTVTDPDFANNLMLLNVTVHSSNPDLIPDEFIRVIRAGYSGLITMQPLTNAFGTAILTVTVTNPNGASVFTTFNYTVQPENDAPTLNPPADMELTANAGPQTIPLSGITTGATNEPQDLVITAFANPPGILTNIQITYTSPNSTGTLNFETVTNATGKVVLDLFVDDGASVFYNIHRSFVVQVNPTNLPPTISPLPDQITDLDTPKNVNFNVADKETDADSLVLSVTSSNPALIPTANVLFSGSSSNRSATLTPVTGQSGVAQLTLTATDAQGAQAQTTFTLTVRPDALQPVISTRPLAQDLGFGTTLQLTSAALGEEPFTYQWQRDNSDIAFQTNATLTLPNAQPADAGAYTVTVVNSKGSVTSLAAQVRVLPPPAFTQIVRPGGIVSLSFTSQTGLTYTIEYLNSYNAIVWNVLRVEPGTGGTITVTDPGSISQTRYYRIRIN
jgi:hypothetical protein